MSDRLFIRDYLRKYCDTLEPKEFYRSIFPVGELETTGRLEKGKYNGIAVELINLGNGEVKAHKFLITDGLEIIDELVESNNFVITSPISYIGRSRKSEYARNIYALAFDLDGITEEKYLDDLFHQIEIEYIPKPTYIVWSGGNIHLYYQFISPMPCFDNVVSQLQKLKTALTKKLWNMYTTSLSSKPQIQSLFQGFRMPGTITKGGNRTEAFLYGDPVDIEYLNSFLDEDQRVKEIVHKSSLSLSEAKDKYPEWYEKRIIQKQPKGTWICKKDLYNWWKRKLKDEIKEGHRYYGIMCLAVYAKKCGIGREELEKDAFELLEFMDSLTVDESNHFTIDDVYAALELYNDSYITFPIDTITELTQIRIDKNKRNGRKQEEHLRRMRAVLEIDYPDGKWRNTKGRPKGSKQAKMVEEWKKANPGGTIKDCLAELPVGKSTVYKYWRTDNEE